MKKFRLLTAMLLVLAMALSACSGSSKKEDPKKDDKPAATTPTEPTATFKYYLVDKPTTFDPIMVTDVSTNQVLQNVLSGLVNFDQKGNVVQDMAAKIDTSADGLTYTFTLKDATYSDGSKVVAADFKKAMVRAMNPALNSPVADTYLDDIAGYSKFLAAKGKIDADLKAKSIDEAKHKAELTTLYEALKNDASITAKDEKTLVITLAAPTPYFLGKLVYPTSYPVKGMPEDKTLAATPANAKLLIGTGAFSMEEYVEGSKVVLKRNPNFYGDKAKVAKVEMPVITADAAQLAAYRSGQIDMSPIPPGDYKTIKADATLGKEVLEFPTARVNYFALNQTKWEPSKNVKVRQAVSHAINREQLNDVVFSGTQFPAYGVLPPGIPGALEGKVQGQKYDVEKAKGLLKDAGFEGGKGLNLKVTYRAKNETSQKLAEFLQNQLKTNLGINVTVEPMEWSALLAASRNKTELESFTLGWSADYIDPQNFLSVLLHTKAPYNRYGYSNKEFDAVLEKADKMKNGPERLAEYSKAEQMVVNDLGFVPLYFGKSMFLVRSTVKGVQYNAMGIMPLNHVEYTK